MLWDGCSPGSSSGAPSALRMQPVQTELRHAVSRGTGDSLLHKVGAKTHPEDNCSLLRKQLQGTDDNDYRDTFIGGINVSVACGRRY